MADMVRQINVTVPDAFLGRVQVWLDSQPALMQDSGRVDEFGDAIMEPVAETYVQKFDRIVGEYIRRELTDRVFALEEKQARDAVTKIDVK